MGSGVGVTSWDCTGDSSQLWRMDHDRGSSISLGKIRWSLHPHLCIDVFDHGVADGTRIQLWDCLDADSDQVFEYMLQSVNAGKIRWKNHPEYCMDVKDHRTSNGNPMQ